MGFEKRKSFIRNDGFELELFYKLMISKQLRVHLQLSCSLEALDCVV